jgi:hypothetical protein
VTIKHINESNFKTIRGYFGEKKEHQYFRCVARDAENKRGGAYFIVGLDRPVSSLPDTLSARISLVTSLGEGVQTFECEVPKHTRSVFASEIYCGVVSRKIDVEKIKAWNVEFVAGDGSVLCSKSSYMWTM